MPQGIWLIIQSWSTSPNCCSWPCCSRQASAERYSYRKVASEGQRLKSRPRAWFRALRCRLAKASRSRDPAAAQDSEHSHQQQEPLWVTDATPKTSIGDRLEEADQISRCKLINCTGTVLGHGKRIDQPTKPNADRFSKSYQGKLLGGPGPPANIMQK